MSSERKIDHQEDSTNYSLSKSTGQTSKNKETSEKAEGIIFLLLLFNFPLKIATCLI